MGDVLKRRLKQAKFENPVHEALLNLLVTAGHVQEQLARLCDEHGLSPGQYNVLRILRGAHPEGYARCEIAERLIERAPDVTRLVDRLEQQGMVTRGKSSHDARRSVSRITGRGLRLLETMEVGVQAIHREIAARWTPREAREISRLCEKLYGPEVEATAAAGRAPATR